MTIRGCQQYRQLPPLALSLQSCRGVEILFPDLANIVGLINYRCWRDMVPDAAGVGGVDAKRCGDRDSCSFGIAAALQLLWLSCSCYCRDRRNCGVDSKFLQKSSFVASA